MHTHSTLFIIQLIVLIFFLFLSFLHLLLLFLLSSHSSSSIFSIHPSHSSPFTPLTPPLPSPLFPLALSQGCKDRQRCTVRFWVRAIYTTLLHFVYLTSRCSCFVFFVYLCITVIKFLGLYA